MREGLHAPIQSSAAPESRVREEQDLPLRILLDGFLLQVRTTISLTAKTQNTEGDAAAQSSVVHTFVEKVEGKEKLEIIFI